MFQLPCMTDRSFARLLVDLNVELFIDIGANMGQQGITLRVGGYRGSILSLEPSRAAYDRLTRTAHRDDAWDVMMLGVSFQGGRSRINIAPDLGMSSSLLEPTAELRRVSPGAVPSAAESVEVVTLNDVLSKLQSNTKHIWLKMDIQGMEGPILSSISELDSNIVGIKLEASYQDLYAGALRIEELISECRRLGFDLWSVAQGPTSRFGRAHYCDLFVVRQDLTRV